MLECFLIAFGWILDRFLINIEKRRFYENERLAYTKHLFSWFRDMLLEAKIDKKTHSKTEWLLERICDAFCSILEFILDPKRLHKFDQILYKKCKFGPGDPTPQIYTTGAVYKSGGTPGEGLGRGRI